MSEDHFENSCNKDISSIIDKVENISIDSSDNNIKKSTENHDAEENHDTENEDDTEDEEDEVDIDVLSRFIDVIGGSVPSGVEFIANEMNDDEDDDDESENDHAISMINRELKMLENIINDGGHYHNDNVDVNDEYDKIVEIKNIIMNKKDDIKSLTKAHELIENYNHIIIQGDDLKFMTEIMGAESFFKDVVGMYIIYLIRCVTDSIEIKPGNSDEDTGYEIDDSTEVSIH